MNLVELLGLKPKAVKPGDQDPRALVAGLVRRARAGDQHAMALIAQNRVSASVPGPRGDLARKMQKHILSFIKANPVPKTEIAFGGAVRTAGEILGAIGGVGAIMTIFGAEEKKRLGVLKAVTNKSTPVDCEEHDLQRLHTAVHALLGLPPPSAHMGADGTPPPVPKAAPVAIVLLAQGLPLTDNRLALLCQSLTPGPAKEAFTQAVVSGEAPTSPNPYAYAGQIVGRARSLQLATRRGQPISRWSASMGCELGEYQ
jgi:hypothetical protein